jgi:hypothetical protein
MSLDTLSGVGTSTLRLRGGLEVRQAAATRRAMLDFLDAADPGQQDSPRSLRRS